jgi:glutamyl-tRNA reductase
VDPSIGQTSQLYNIEQLDRLIEQSRGAQSSDLERCEEFVRENTLRLARIYRDKQASRMVSVY